MENNNFREFWATKRFDRIILYIILCVIILLLTFDVVKNYRYHQEIDECVSYISKKYDSEFEFVEWQDRSKSMVKLTVKNVNHDVGNITVRKNHNPENGKPVFQDNYLYAKYQYENEQAEKQIAENIFGECRIMQNHVCSSTVFTPDEMNASTTYEEFLTKCHVTFQFKVLFLPSHPKPTNEQLQNFTQQCVDKIRSYSCEIYYDYDEHDYNSVGGLIWFSGGKSPDVTFSHDYRTISTDYDAHFLSADDLISHLNTKYDTEFKIEKVITSTPKLCYIRAKDVNNDSFPFQAGETISESTGEIVYKDNYILNKTEYGAEDIIDELAADAFGECRVVKKYHNELSYKDTTFQPDDVDKSTTFKECVSKCGLQFEYIILVYDNQALPSKDELEKFKQKCSENLYSCKCSIYFSVDRSDEDTEASVFWITNNYARSDYSFTVSVD